MLAFESHAPNANLILGSISPEIVDKLNQHLEWVQLDFGATLYRAHEVQKFVYFPVSGIVSLMYLTKNGTTAEIGVCGRDGAVGLFSCLTGGQTTSQALVQADGHAYRVSGHVVRDLASEDPGFAALLFAYAQVVWTQVSQTAVCNRYHSIPQQFCRWLLHSADLVGDQIQMTQQLMAEMIGVRREGVNAAASDLRDQGLINYARGRISILDRHALVQQSCECYAVVYDEVRRLMPRPPDYREHFRDEP